LSDATQYPVFSGAEAFAKEGAADAPATRREIGLGIIHGFSGNPVSMRPLAERLASVGFRVDVPRLPGHGTHPRDMQRTRYADWRAEVVRTVDRLSQTSKHVALVGLSMGALLALDVGCERQELLAVVCINPQILDRKGFAVKLAPMLEYVVPMAPASLAGLRKDDIAKPGVSEKAYDWVPSAAGNSLLRELPRVRAGLKKLKPPLLVAHSVQDHSVPPENSAALLRLVPGARELLLERSYHVATLDYDLELLADNIAGFCEELAR
jgi:carboxylesterase